MRRLIAPALLAAMLAACATPTFYQPSQRYGAVGFNETQLEQDRYRVSFRGGAGAPAAQVADYALLRAAELALGGGYDWFVVDQRYTEGAGGHGGGPRFSVGAGGTDFGRSSAFGLGVGTSFGLGGSGQALTTTLEVRLGRGTKPAGQNVYDARDVRRAVAPRAGLPA